MITVKKASLLAAVGVMLVPAAVFAADNGPQDVVKDKRGNIVRNTHGNCVLTKWQSATDECSGAPAAVKRDVRTKLSKEERTVYFDFNKSTLNAREKAKLDDLSRIIKESKEVESIDIVGYADPIGKSSYNKKLSDKRAATVKSYLASKGLKTRNVRVEGKGESNVATNCQTPVDGKKASKETIACLAEDRRVEVELNVAK